MMAKAETVFQVGRCSGASIWDSYLNRGRLSRGNRSFSGVVRKIGSLSLRAFFAARLRGCEKARNCHSEGQGWPEESAFFSMLQKSRSLVSLEMTTSGVFPQLVP